MRIGIIGAGNIGGTLARKLTELGDQVRVANSRGPASLASLAKETGARAVAVEDAVRDVDLVIVTVPEKSVPELPKGLFDRVPRYGRSRVATRSRIPVDRSFGCAGCDTQSVHCRFRAQVCAGTPHAPAGPHTVVGSDSGAAGPSPRRSTVAV